jgi:hypothetical protein
MSSYSFRQLIDNNVLGKGKPIMKLKRLTKKVMPVMAGCSAFPLLTDVTFVETTFEQSQQLSAYREKLGKEEITTSILEGVDRDTGNADIKISVNDYHKIALDTIAFDHSPVDDGTPENQGAPTLASRAIPMIHIGMFAGINAIDTHYESFTGGNTLWM